MELDFNNSYVLAVLVLLWALCFCRNFLDSFVSFIGMLDKCIEHDVCCIGPCLSACKLVGIGALLRQSVIVFCFIQPAIFCGIYLYNKSPGTERYSSTILHNIHLNSTRLHYKSGNISALYDPEPVDNYNLMEIDYLIIVIPFSLMVSGTSLLWVHSINSGYITADMPWDIEMHESVFVYEVAYYIEVCAMNFSFLAVICTERSLLEVHYAGLSLTMIMIYTFSKAKCSSEYNAVEHIATIMLMICLFAILAPLWIDMMPSACMLSTAVATVHACIVLTLTSFHCVARGESTCGQLLLVRLICTLLACATHLTVYLVGRNQNC